LALLRLRSHRQSLRRPQCPRRLLEPGAHQRKVQATDYPARFASN
jgi:hypothetical protein